MVTGWLGAIFSEKHLLLVAHGHLPADFGAVVEAELWSLVYLALSLFPATETG